MAKVVLQQSSSRDDSGLVFKRNGLCFLLLSTSAMLIVYFILSIGLTFYQRWLVQQYRYPLSIVLCHLVIKFACASVYRNIWQCVYKRKRVMVDCKNQLVKIAPIGITSSLDIAFSNWGIEYITVSLYVMTKSTSIIFLLGFAVLFKLEKKSWSIVLIVLMISGGLGLFTYKEDENGAGGNTETGNKQSEKWLVGFFLVLFASFSSGLRWTLTQFVMQRADMGLRNPLDMLYHAQPWMMVTTLPLAAFVEGNDLISGYNSSDWKSVFHGASLVVAGAFLALAMELSEYLVVTCTSSLTLSVSSIFKEICTLVLDVEFNGTRMSAVNDVGLFLCMGGIVCHVLTKAAETRAPPTALHKPLLDQTARFLVDDGTTSEEEERDDDSDKVLFNILNSRES